MSSESGNPVTEHANEILAQLRRYEEAFRELTSRVASLERLLAGLVADQGAQNERIDRIAEKVVRIERRLDRL